MKHKIVGFFIILVTAACSTQRMICPAYQSAFIHDQETLRKKFSYFGEDSMPKILEASKDKHLLIDPVTYRKRLKALQTVAMVDIYPQQDDSLAFDDDMKEELLIASQEAKSGDLYNEADLLKEMPDGEGQENLTASAADSIYMISLKKEKFNIDQELYLWYLRKFLVYPDVKIQMEANAEAQGEAIKEQKKGFFGKLFGGKKQKEQAEIDLQDSDSELTEGEPKKKGLFSSGKKGDKKAKEKKKKKNESVEEDALEEATPEEEEDDGENDF